MARDEPLLVVDLDPLEERETQLLDGAERVDPEKLLLERAEEALGDAVAFRRPNERRARLGAEPGELALEGVAHVLAPVVVTHLEAVYDAFGVGAVPRAYGLTDRLESLEARAALRGVDADALGRAVVDGSEDGDVALGERVRGRRVCPPHLVGALGRDRPVVGTGPEDATSPGRRQESVFAHEPQHALLGGTNALRAESSPGFAVPFAREHRLAEHGTDLDDERCVVELGLGATFLGRCGRRVVARSLLVVVRRPCDPEDLGNEGHAVRTLGGGRHGAAQPLDLRQGKGEAASSRRVFSIRSSLRIASSPTIALRRRISSSWAVGSRLLSAA